MKDYVEITIKMFSQESTTRNTNISVQGLWFKHLGFGFRDFTWVWVLVAPETFNQKNQKADYQLVLVAVVYQD